MTSRAKEIADQLCTADRRALLSAPGLGNFSSAAFRRLRDNLLMDDSFWPRNWDDRCAPNYSSRHFIP